MAGRGPNRIAVLLGGRSAEREVSLSSGRGCVAALRREGFAVLEIDAGATLAEARTLPGRLVDAAPDVVFNALHGPWGEDGTVQGLLAWMGLPYTHSGVLASALALDKTRAKEVLRAAGLPVAEGGLFPRTAVEAAHVMAPPYVVKPNDEGSSVGIYIVHADANGPPLLADTMPATVMVERFVPGRELTCTVLDGEATAVTEIFAEGWYDFHAKYAAGGSRHVIPAELPEAVSAECRAMAVRAHEALGCRSVSRTDFRWDEGGAGLVVLETNTQPGMTPTSLTPEAAEQMGISFGALCRRLVEDAWDAR